MNTSRFKNSYENEYTWCQGCDQKLHYSALSIHGYCQDCQCELDERAANAAEAAELKKQQDEGPHENGR